MSPLCSLWNDGRRMKGIMMMKNDIVLEPLTVNAKTAASMLGVCERTVRTLTKKGELPVVRILGRVLYRPNDLIAYVSLKTQRALDNGDEQNSPTPS